ncbi:MAG: HTH-type transcriptional repressor YvoA [Deltaproteobacteria bacterium]|jgi:GntR family transcriptional regulator|nr:HTH-type transcriptional repressor YvoA [Deltaproteobacteria bacterium]
MDIIVNPNVATPLYQQIKEYCQSNIQSGNFPVDSRLPSERQLAEKFEVSRMTVTKAFKELEREGWVYARSGKGTFVAPQTIIDQTLDTLSSFSEDMAEQNLTVTSKILYQGVEPAGELFARKLWIDPGSLIFVLERVRMADEEVISLERAHIPYALCPEIEKKFDFSQESLYSVLREKYTLQLVIAQQTVEARKPTIEEMRKLAIEQADPVLSFERTTLNAKSQPVEFARSVYLGDRYKLRVQLKPTSSSVQGEGQN